MPGTEERQNPVRDWKALVRAWEKRDQQRSSGPGTVADAVQGIVAMAQARRSARQRNTLLNYDEKPSHAKLEEIELDLDEL